MRHVYTIIALLFSLPSFGQARTCNCSIDSVMIMMRSNINCKTTILKNGSTLYWQYDCDSIWLTLQSKNGRATVINKVDLEHGPYLYRLGYQLLKEYASSLLFRYGCPATSSCDYILIDKTTGKEIKEFDELIYDYSTDTFFDFLIYFSPDSASELVLYHVANGRKYKIDVSKHHFILSHPEYRFQKVALKNNILILSYIDDNGIEKKVTIDLKKYPAR